MILAFTDTETTGLDPIRHEMWEVAVIRREADGAETEHLWQIRPPSWHLAHIADAKALEIGRYHERAAVPEPAMAADMLAPGGPAGLDFLDLGQQLVAALDGAVLVGSNPGFDAAFLHRWLQIGSVPWHYRPLDVPTLAAGFLWGTQPELMARDTKPINSRWLSRQFGVEPPVDGVAHTALGDARWIRDFHDAVTGGGR